MKFICLFLFSIQPLLAQRTLQLASPNGTVRFQCHLTANAPLYDISFQGRPVIERASLGLVFRDGAWGKSLVVKGVKRRQKDETYELAVGKNRRVRNHYREMSVECQSTEAHGWRVVLRVRAYDDGVAFRYEFPEQPHRTAFALTEEQSSFHFAGDPTLYALFLPHYRTSHEGLYTTTTLSAVPADTLIDLPAVFQLSDSLFVAVTEAALRDYAGLYLQKSGARTLTSRLSPWPGQTELKVQGELPHRSPWRVVMLADHPGRLIESNLLTSLNEPPAFSDLSWLKPGKTTWTWWHGDVIKDVDFPVGLNFETQRYYIDWCAANGIAYHAIIEHGNRAWYKGDGEGFDPPPPNADVTKPVDSLEMDRLADYSRQKGVGLRVWVHWKPLSEKLEEAFAQYEKWNIQGLMIDFMDRDDQEMVRWQEKVLQTAARYHLHVQFHGAYKPTGLSRTYPNEFTREGVLNLENLKWSNECDPEHNLMIPFTRMLAGATDYHAGGFRAVPRDRFQASYIEPNVMGTRCHHLALYVVFESYLHMVSDYPQAYDDQPGFEFVRQVPTTWDETRVLDGKVGDYLIVARRKGDDWYVGAMNDWTPRTLQTRLDFLPEGEFVADIFSDTDAATPDQLKKTSRPVRRADSIEMRLTAGGGQAIRIRKKK